jgi:hypothetical protein
MYHLIYHEAMRRRGTAKRRKRGYESMRSREGGDPRCRLMGHTEERRKRGHGYPDETRKFNQEEMMK